MKRYNIVIIGGGPAGLAAAAGAYEAGERSILILERDIKLGGILNQCIHNGFGLHTFKEDLTGPEFASHYVKKIKEYGIDYKLNTMVLELSKEKMIAAVNREDGMFFIQAKSIILCMGCRERSRGSLGIPGYRPSGIYSAGTAQRMINIEGRMPGKEIVILGSGDIGLIMARRLTLEGAHVICVAEIMPYSGGLKRNIVQCLEDFGIPLYLNHTVTKIKGRKRVEGIELSEVTKDFKPIEETKRLVRCDTLLLSCGLIPENELSRELDMDMNSATNGPIVNESLETSMSGVFAAGNVLHVHDLVDNVVDEANRAGRAASQFVKGETKGYGVIPVTFEGKIRYTVPSFIRPENVEDKVKIFFRTDSVIENCTINVFMDDIEVVGMKRRIITPGQMEEVVLDKSLLDSHITTESIHIQIKRS